MKRTRGRSYGVFTVVGIEQNGRLQHGLSGPLLNLPTLFQEG